MTVSTVEVVNGSGGPYQRGSWAREHPPMLVWSFGLASRFRVNGPPRSPSATNAITIPLTFTFTEPMPRVY